MTVDGPDVRVLLERGSTLGGEKRWRSVVCLKDGTQTACPHWHPSDDEAMACADATLTQAGLHRL
jgi:hypothetical protein